jgi:hypothetical protein
MSESTARTYEPAAQETIAFIQSVMSQYHPTLKSAGVTIGAAMASGPRDKNDEITGPAIKHGGYRALATVKITSLKDRAYGLADALILIDGDEWPAMNEARRRALIDHEMEHLEYTGERDDLDRPKLAMRLHDYYVSGFASVAKRHGPQSIECQHVSDLLAEHEQVLFPWMSDRKPGTVSGKAANVTISGTKSG